ncbi:MAG: PorT family protein [Muribaculaceae bacterium]|nr:PorT family protein [Muribaculaceae bacterium]
MNIIKRGALVVALILAVASTASAQFRFGVRAGIQTNALHFNESTFDSDNRAGFTGGVMAEFTAPVIGIGVDLGVMYTHRTAQFTDKTPGATTETKTDKRDYIEIPLNLKWRISLPVVDNIIRPYIFTGPSFAILTSKKAFEAAFQNRSCDVAWNVGAGVELFKHVQVGAGYGFGLTKAFEKLGTVGTNGESGIINSRTRCWTITAAYLF